MTRPKSTPTPRNVFFLYSRKSTEAEDRQILSIDSQIDDVQRLAERLGLAIGEIFTEARSAKAPGRPVFNDMMRRIAAGEAAGILCWKLDRLARNPMDGGSLIWAVRQHRIRIMTPTQTYSHEDDNIILMYIEFGMAHKYVDDLGRAVKRGLLAKAQRGLYPGALHLGYIHDPRQPKGLKGLVMDPERFPLVRRLWELMLIGTYSATRIVSLANDEWGFHMPSGKPLSRSTIYRLFTNPLYCGRFEYPVGSGHWFEGIHEPMITEAEFNQVQTLLGSRGRPRRISRSFAFTGLVRCGECGAMVTAEEKYQLICSTCRLKFAYRKKDRCPGCNMRIQTMLDRPGRRRPKLLRYVYYHCTKRTIRACRERSIRVEDIESDIAAYIERIEVSENFKNWVLERLRHSFVEEAATTEALVQARQKSYNACLARLESLVRLKTAPENVDGSLLSDDEYASQRAMLLREKIRLLSALKDAAPPVTDSLRLVEEVFDFASQARAWLSHQDDEIKRLILAVFNVDGSNLTLRDKQLRIDAPKPFPTLEEFLPRIPAAVAVFEPEKRGLNKREKDAFASFRPIECGQRNDVRTYGEAGLQLAQALRSWIEAATLDELLALRERLHRLFQRVKSRQQAE